MRALLVLLAGTLLWATAAGAQTVLTVDARPGGDTALTVTLRGAALDEVVIEGAEVIARFAGGITPEGVDRVAEAHGAWIETIEYGFDQIVIRFAPEARLLTERTGDGLTITASRPTADEAPPPPPGAAPDPQRVRLNYYRALALIESGAVADGRAILVAQHRADPRNIEVLLLLARTEERMGRPRRAVALYDKALALDPELPFAIRDRQRLARDLADTARISTRYQDVENGETQVITTVDGQLSSREGLSLEYLVETRSVDAGAVTRRDGRVELFEGDRQRGAATIRLPRDGTLRLESSLFASNHVAGAGVGLDFDFGDSGVAVLARWSEPNFNFVEGIIDGGARDRVAVDWGWQYADTVEFSAGGALNRYTLDGDHDEYDFG